MKSIAMAAAVLMLGSPAFRSLSTSWSMMVRVLGLGAIEGIEDVVVSLGIGDVDESFICRGFVKLVENILGTVWTSRCCSAREDECSLMLG